MRLHDLELLGRESARLEQDRIADGHFADVVQRAGSIQVGEKLCGDLRAIHAAAPELLGEKPCVAADPNQVLPRIVVPRFGQFRQGEHRKILHGRGMPVVVLNQLLDFAAPGLHLRLDRRHPVNRRAKP